MKIVFYTAALLLLLPAMVSARWFTDVELGVAIPGYNDVQVPNDSTGTRFSLSNSLDVQPEFIYRIRVGYITGKNSFSLFAAPLSLSGEGVLQNDIDFAGVTFPQGSDVTGLYRFDSYRFTWRYRLIDTPSWSLAGGLTAKIRDAEIRLESGGLSGNTTNTGFVPLLSFDLKWKPFSRGGIQLEGDALVGPQGRAEDVMLAGFYSISPKIDLRAGYRIVEGGADVESVYNFTLVNYLTAGVNLSF